MQSSVKSKKRVKFPSLKMCEEKIRRSVSDHRLTKFDRHIIGTLWAYLEDFYLSNTKKQTYISSVPSWLKRKRNGH
jgi:hypothetical protein